jgi:hypothetical protein
MKTWDEAFAASRPDWHLDVVASCLHTIGAGDLVVRAVPGAGYGLVSLSRVSCRGEPAVLVTVDVATPPRGRSRDRTDFSASALLTLDELGDWVESTWKDALPLVRERFADCLKGLRPVVRHGRTDLPAGVEPALTAQRTLSVHGRARPKGKAPRATSPGGHHTNQPLSAPVA